MAPTPIREPAATYELLRMLTSPVCAVTSRHGDKLNGMITDGVVRASIVPDIPRMLVIIHKVNLSHHMVFESGRFCLHVLHEGQIPVVEALGFTSGRDADKMAKVPHTIGTLGLPVLAEHVVAFECDVINAMDTGSSTIFMGEAKETWQGSGTPMSPFYLRDHIPAHWGEHYMKNLKWAQDWARERSRDIKPLVWKGLQPAK